MAWRNCARGQNRQGQAPKLVMSVKAMLHVYSDRNVKFIHMGSLSQALIYQQWLINNTQCASRLIFANHEPHPSISLCLPTIYRQVDAITVNSRYIYDNP